MAKIILILSVMVLALAACSRQQPVSGETITGKSAIATGDNSRNALDWAGTYQGVLPCASCPGIETTLVLNSDQRYQLTRYYRDEKDSPFQETGSFAWDSSGGEIILQDGSRYLVGENQLFLLDQQGERIEGNLAGNYRLAKIR
ncbi:MAG: copper resistance protein NlpE [Porticoccaceae bacterium]|nr:copper resistance protein NlpE [Porticoccaceae bacterium]